MVSFRGLRWKRLFENMGDFLCESFLKSRQWCPLCAHLCLFLLGQRYSSIRCSSELSHGCTSSKRVQLSWHDSWQFISDLAAQGSTSLSPLSSSTLTSHNMTPALFSIHMFSKLSAAKIIYNVCLKDPWKVYVLFLNIGATQNAVKNYTNWILSINALFRQTSQTQMSDITVLLSAD